MPRGWGEKNPTHKTHRVPCTGPSTRSTGVYFAERWCVLWAICLLGGGGEAFVWRCESHPSPKPPRYPGRATLVASARLGEFVFRGIELARCQSPTLPSTCEHSQGSKTCKACRTQRQCSAMATVRAQHTLTTADISSVPSQFFGSQLVRDVNACPPTFSTSVQYRGHTVWCCELVFETAPALATHALQ